MATESSRRLKIFRTEDYWAIWLGLLVILACLVAFWSGSSLSRLAVTPGTWSSFDELADDLVKKAPAFAAVFAFFFVTFTVSMKIMGHEVRSFMIGFTVLFLGALAVFYLAGWEAMERLDLGAPLLALLVGIVIGNLATLPEWLKSALRTEYYIKTGIVLLGATLPMTLIATAGPVAFLQATIVSVTTWMTIFLAATRIFGLDPRFGAVLGTGGAVCGVSGSIAIGGAVKADKDHIAIGIAVVSVWAIVMIFFLAFVTKLMIPPPGVAPTEWWQISSGEAGAWVGTSEYADAAGFAVVAEIATTYGDAAINAFTLMKVIGRDIWIGIWAFVLSIVSVVFWEKRSDADRPTGRLGIGVVWERFPKFVLGFFAASAIMSLIAASAPADHVGRAPVAGSFKSQAQTATYDADFAGFVVPPELADRFVYDAAGGEIRFTGEMTLAELDALSRAADSDQRWALKRLQHASSWFSSELEPKAISPIKKLRSWAFVLCFLCIGLSTRFRDLLTFGLKPFWAFTIGVAVNVPLGWFLTTRVFDSFWSALR
ncbi:MAG: YeiH family protein [Thermoanaerobaculales bacterium]|jgi:uncharacterized membrane protein YadS|nr:YeiH family protein [Thermoanaerobaculales bacterium]